MNKIITVLLFCLVPLFSGCGYNKMVTADEAVHAAWGQVENQYQRRSDLVPNLVETVRGYTDHEEETLVAVMEARSEAVSTDVNLEDEASMDDFMQAQSQLDSALSRLLVSVEAYPELQASGLYRDLMHQLEGTENRIAVARMDYNQAVQEYNLTVRVFPRVLFARMFGFEPYIYPYFQAEGGAATAPEVDFGDE